MSWFYRVIEAADWLSAMWQSFEKQRNRLIGGRVVLMEIEYLCIETSW